MAWDDDTDFYDEDEEEKQKYDTAYTTTMSAKLKEIDDDDREAIFRELRDLRYDPSNKPETDAELNILRAKNLARAKRRQLTGATASYVKYLAQRDGLTLKDAERKVRNLSRGGDE